MNHLLPLFLLLSSAILTAQDYLDAWTMEQDRVVYSEVIEVTGTADELYDKAIKWIPTYYGALDADALHAERDAHYIRYADEIPVAKLSLFIKYEGLKSMLTIDTKDDKIRVQMREIDLLVKILGNDDTMQLKGFYDHLYRKNGKPVKKNHNMAKGVYDIWSDILDSITTYMNTDDEW